MHDLRDSRYYFGLAPSCRRSSRSPPPRQSGGTTPTSGTSACPSPTKPYPSTRRTWPTCPRSSECFRPTDKIVAINGLAASSTPISRTLTAPTLPTSDHPRAAGTLTFAGARWALKPLGRRSGRRRLVAAGLARRGGGLGLLITLWTVQYCGAIVAAASASVSVSARWRKWAGIHFKFATGSEADPPILSCGVPAPPASGRCQRPSGTNSASMLAASNPDIGPAARPCARMDRMK